MRIAIASAFLLAACQPGEPIANNAIDAGNAATNTARDTIVSSNDSAAEPNPTPDGTTPDCPILKSSDWRAHVDAMPGPNNNPRLIVSGRVTVPTGGYRLSLRMGQVAESYPVQVTAILDVTPPSGPATQALETHDVRGEWPSEQRVGAVSVRCGSRVIARISNVETAF